MTDHDARREAVEEARQLIYTGHYTAALESAYDAGAASRDQRIAELQQRYATATDEVVAAHKTLRAVVEWCKRERDCAAQMDGVVDMDGDDLDRLEAIIDRALEGGGQAPAGVATQTAVAESPSTEPAAPNLAELRRLLESARRPLSSAGYFKTRYESGQEDLADQALALLPKEEDR